jgi:hypothetical protein
MANFHNPLFIRQDRVTLGMWIQYRADAGVRSLVEALPEAAFAKMSDEQIIEQIADEASLAPLEVDFDHAKANVQETTVEINNIFGRRAGVKGLRATKTIPFKGSPDLWHLLPSRHGTSHPEGYVSGRTVVVGVDVPANEADTAPTRIAGQIEGIKRNLAQQAADLAEFNNGLAARIAPLVQRRRARLEAAAKLQKSLQQ